MDYLFLRKNSIMELEDDRDPYPWIIWYIWKVRNDKLFRGINRDPLELSGMQRVSIRPGTMQRILYLLLHMHKLLKKQKP